MPLSFCVSCEPAGLCGAIQTVEDGLDPGGRAVVGGNTFISRPAWAPHHGLPFEKLRFGFGAEVVEQRERFAVVVFELLEETFGWWRG